MEISQIPNYNEQQYEKFCKFHIYKLVGQLSLLPEFSDTHVLQASAKAVAHLCINQILSLKGMRLFL